MEGSPKQPASLPSLKTVQREFRTKSVDSGCVLSRRNHPGVSWWLSLRTAGQGGVVNEVRNKVCGKHQCIRWWKVLSSLEESGRQGKAREGGPGVCPLGTSLPPYSERSCQELVKEGGILGFNSQCLSLNAKNLGQTQALLGQVFIQAGF